MVVVKLHPRDASSLRSSRAAARAEASTSGRGLRYNNRKPLPTEVESIETYRLQNLEALAKAVDNLVVLTNFDLLEFHGKLASNRVPLAKAVPQPGLPVNRLRAADGPRLVVDKYRRFVMFYCPQFWSPISQSKMLSDVDVLTKSSPFKHDDAKPGGDRRKGGSSKLKSKSAYWNLHIHGIAQQYKNPLRPSTTLRLWGQEKGIAARKRYLESRAGNDYKINHMTDLLHPALYDALEQSMMELSKGARESARWTSHWYNVFPALALMENRVTKIHRDTNGAAFCADFLYLLGDFQDGDLKVPDLNLSIQWGSGDACMFDGRTLSHQVEHWSGTRRLCFSHYLWKTSMTDLKIDLPVQVPELEGIVARLRNEQAEGSSPEPMLTGARGSNAGEC